MNDNLINEFGYAVKLAEKGGRLNVTLTYDQAKELLSKLCRLDTEVHVIRDIRGEVEDGTRTQ